MEPRRVFLCASFIVAAWTRLASADECPTLPVASRPCAASRLHSVTACPAPVAISPLHAKTGQSNPTDTRTERIGSPRGPSDFLPETLGFPTDPPETPADTLEFPADTLEVPAEEALYDTLEYALEEEVYEEESYHFFEFPAWFGLEMSGGFCATGNYESMVGGAITYGKAMSENGWLELSVGYSATPLQQASPLRKTVNDSPGMISFAGRVRASLSPPEMTVRYHFLVGVGMDFLLWTYDTPINTAEDEGGVTYVSDDNLPGIDLHFGIGFTMFRGSGALITAELVPGVKLWFDETRNGFTNDLFSSYGFVVLKLQAALEVGQ